MKNEEVLIPKIELEYNVLNHIAEKLVSGGDLVDVKEILYHRETSELFDRIKSGEDCLNDITLPNSFLTAYMAKIQFDNALVRLSDLKARRSFYRDSMESVFNFDIDYATKDDSCTWDDTLKSAVQRAKDNPRGFLPNEFTYFWDAIRGFMPGEVIGIAGGSGSGKTTFAIDLLSRLQMKYKCKTAFVSCEMTKEALGDKIIKRENNLNQSEYNRTASENSESILKADYKNWSDCSFHYKINSLDGLKSFLKKHKPKFFALDYAQMILSTGRYNSGDWSLRFATELKDMCKDLGTTCIELLQFDKDAQKLDAKGNQKIPSLVDIFGGTGYKQGLDTGLVLYTNHGKRYVYIDKARDTYEERLMWKHFEVQCNSETGKIYNLEPKQDFRIPD